MIVLSVGADDTIIIVVAWKLVVGLRVVVLVVADCSLSSGQTPVSQGSTEQQPVNGPLVQV